MVTQIGGMRSRFVALAAIASFAPAVAAPAQDCATFDQPDARRLVAALDTMAAVPPVWGTFTIANHPIVLVSQSTTPEEPACAAIWRHRRPLQVLTVERGVRFSTPLYGMWNGDPVGPNARVRQLPGTGDSPTIPPALERALRGGGDTRVVIIHAILDFDRMGALGDAMRQMRADPVRLLAPIAVHESYHLHSQFPAWLDQPGRYAWPAWDVQPDRRALVAQCYNGSDAIKAALRAEMAALEKAWLSSLTARDDTSRTRVREESRAFIDARHARYALLDTVRIGSPGAPLTCEQAEDVMELQEGVSQWIGFATAVRAGVVAPASAGRQSAEAFYVMGLFQLDILRNLLGNDEMIRISDGVSRSHQSSGREGAVFGRFQALVGR